MIEPFPFLSRAWVRTVRHVKISITPIRGSLAFSYMKVAHAKWRVTTSDVGGNLG